MVKRLLLFTFLVLAIASTKAQEVSKNVQRADRAFEDNNYKKALDLYVKASSEEAVTAYIARQIGNCYRMQGDMVQAEIWYENSLKQVDHTNLDLLLLGYTQKANGKNELSIATLNKLYVLQNLPDLSSTSNGAKTFVARLRNGFLNYKIEPASINSPEADFSPSICRDAIVYATSRFDRDLAKFNQINPQQHLNIFSAKLSSSGELGTPLVFANELLNQLYTGPIAFSPSNDTAYFVRKKFLLARYGDEKQIADNNLKIHRALFVQGKWVDQGPVNFCSDDFSVGDPAISPDGKKIFYTSDMPGGVGGADLWYREIKPNGTFGDAVNLGNKVNTPGNEMTPFVAKDGTLFFSSDKLPGFGNLDLFAAFPTAFGYDYVTNLGYPINGSFDDFGIVINDAGAIGFISSNRPGGAGDDDIFKVSIEKVAVTHTVDGQVIDEKGAPVPMATIKVFEDKNLINTISTDASGKFTFKINDGHEVNLQLDCPGFFQTTSKASTFGLGLKPTQIPVKLTMNHDVGFTLTGIILSASDGAPITNAQVIAFPPDSTKAIVGVTDQIGRFSYKLENETDYRIRTDKVGYVSKTFNLSTKTLKRGEINLSVLFDTKLVPDMKPGISGIVTDSKTSLPLSDVIVTLSSTTLAQSIKLATSSTGMFSQTNISMGDYQVKIEKDGYKPMNIPVTIGKQPVNLNSMTVLALEPLASGLVAVGLVSNKDDNVPVAEATVTLLNKTTNEKIQGKTDEFGSFDFKVEPDRIYILKLEKDKFFAKTLMVSTQGVPAGMLNLNTTYDLKMEAIVVNKAIEIPNIYYDLGKATIKPEAAQELDKVVKLLTDNPTIQIELSSHTDSRGGAPQNLQLSQQRAEAATKYIVSKGINKIRIIAKGYGDTMIKNQCTKGVKCTEAEHAVNRRTEIKIISF
jgi:outer membrane protein OmpA-like peptidoglycan-associated protein/tetratricopeptide (TPR) repeat protein